MKTVWEKEGNQFYYDYLIKSRHSLWVNTVKLIITFPLPQATEKQAQNIDA